MTAASATIDFTHNSDATFRTWGQALSNLIVAAGMAKTTDTGQMNRS